MTPAALDAARRSGRAGRAATAGAVGVLLLWLSVPVFGGAGVVQGAYLVGSVLAAVAMWIGLWWRRPATPAPWRWLAAGLTAWAVADVVYAAYGWFGHPDPSVSVADALYFSGYGAVAIGLVLVIRARKPGGDLDALLDAAAVGVAALVMAWDLLIQPAIDPSASTGATVLFALYPVSDVILLALLVRLLLDTRLRSTPVVLLVAALCTWLVGDAAYSVLATTGSYEFGGTVWLDEVFLAGMFLMAGAALHPDMAAMTDERAEPRAERPYRLALGVVCVAVPGIAAAAADLAESSFKRVDGLAREGLVAAQKRDEAEANFKASRDQALAAKAQYDLARSGARAEDKSAASAQARQVAGVVAEVQAAQAETELKSPVAGEVAKVLARTGELSPQGVAVVTVVDLNDQWVVLNVREDRLQRFAIGKEFDATLPALGGKTVKFKVYHTAALPNFATWRATRAGQGFDARTFEVRARPAAPIEGARPGMTVLVN